MGALKIDQWKVEWQANYIAWFYHADLVWDHKLPENSRKSIFHHEVEKLFANHYDSQLDEELEETISIVTLKSPNDSQGLMKNKN